MSYFIFPKKTEEDPKYIITTKKIILALIVVLVVVACMKVNSVGNLSRQLLESKAVIVILKFSEWGNSQNAEKIFTQDPFCGFMAVSPSGTIFSTGFEETSQNGQVVERVIIADGVKTTASICISDSAKQAIKESTGRNVIFILLLGAALFLMVFYGMDKNPEEDNGNENETAKEKIPNA